MAEGVVEPGEKHGEETGEQRIVLAAREKRMEQRSGLLECAHRLIGLSHSPAHGIAKGKVGIGGCAKLASRATTSLGTWGRRFGSAHQTKLSPTRLPPATIDRCVQRTCMRSARQVKRYLAEIHLDTPLC